MLGSEKRKLLSVTLIAVAVRVAAFFVWPNLPAEDTDGYLGLAANLLDGRGFVDGTTGRPTAFRPPLYPMLLALANILPFGFQLLQIGAGAVTVWLTGIIADRLRLRCAWFPAAIVALDPTLIAYTPRAMTEVVSAMTVAGLLWTLGPTTQSPSWSRAFAVGCAFGLAALCRPTILAMGPFAMAILVFQLRDSDRREIVQRTVCSGLGVLTFLLPWTVRNAMDLGSPIFATTHGGYTLLLGNNPEFYNKVARGSWTTIWDSRPWQAELREDFEASGVDPGNEVAEDGWMYQRAKNNIRADTSGFFAACIVRARRFWNLAPLVEQQSKLIMWGMRGFYAAVFLGLIMCIFRPPADGTRWYWMVMASMVLAFTLVHLFYWSNTRMRAPLSVSIALLSAHGWLGCRKHSP